MTHDEPLHILIIRFSSLGDIVLTTPLIRCVRRHFPNARIDFVTKKEFAELLQSNPHLDRVYEYDSKTGFRGLCRVARLLRKQQYELCIDIHKNYRSYALRMFLQPIRSVSYPKHIFTRFVLVKTGINHYEDIVQIPDRYLQGLRSYGVVNDQEGLELFPAGNQYSTVNALLEREGVDTEQPLIGFGPAAAHPLKEWPAKRFVKLGVRCVEQYQARIALFGGPEDVEKAEFIARQLPNHPIVLCGKLSLLESAAALERCALFVGNDTGLAHIAAAMKRKVIVLFGPTVEEFGFYPYGTRSIVLSKPLSCRPCTHTGKGECPMMETHACMKRITVDDAWGAVNTMFQEGFS